MESPLWIVKNLWLIPILPFAAALLAALLPQAQKKISQAAVILCMAVAFLLSLCAGSALISHGGEHGHEVSHLVSNFDWFSFGNGHSIRLGFLLDPLSAMMLFVVTLVSLLVFIFSVGYMDEDENATRFFCFLSLFAGSMLMLVVANSLLLLFMAWELVGLSSFLLIGFWYHKPSAVAAMKKAFITTRIGDVGFLIGLVLYYHYTGTSLFYDNGQGSLEPEKLALLAGMGTSLLVSLLIFCGAVGKSGQFPLHVWLPDAMEGPTPVSALIHAATMVAAGVFLVGRMYPVFQIDPRALYVVAFVGAFTAVFAATIAFAQWDIKRILAYSTVSQLGYMMMGLGVGGYVAGSFHLFTHAFFKALLFLGSGSIIHACHHEQDIRKMGGLKDKTPYTWIFYMVGMLALAGFPGFAGFFSKDELLLSAWHFEPAGIPHWAAKIPFIFGLVGAACTAFYMTRQVKYVFWGNARGHGAEHAHESGPSMLFPLAVLAAMSIIAGIIGTPWKNLFHHFIAPSSGAHELNWYIMGVSTLIVFIAMALGWTIYSGRALEEGAQDPLEALAPKPFKWLENKYYIDELYARSFIALNESLSKASAFIDRFVIGGFIIVLSWIVLGLSKINHMFDELAINSGFDKSCEKVRKGSRLNRYLQNGFSQHYLKLTSFGIVILFVLAIFLGRHHS